MARSWKTALGALVLTASAAPLAAQPMPSQAGMMGPGMGPGMGPMMGPPMGGYGDDRGYVGDDYPGLIQGPGGACCPPQGGCDDECGPLRGWYVRGEALALTRTTAMDRNIAVDPTNGIFGPATTNFNTGNLDFDHTVGPRITVGKMLSDCYSFETVYFGMHMQSSVALSGAGTLLGTLQTPFQQAGVSPAGINIAGALTNFSTMDISYESDLQNVEMNLRINRGQGFWGSRRSSLIGVRYISLYERLNMSSVNALAAPAPPAVYHVDTFNNLIGPQLGTEWAFAIRDRLALNLWTKAGLMANVDGQRSTLSDELGNTQFTTRHRTQLAGLIEAGILGEWAIKRNWSLFGGYQVYHLSGIALAPDQLDYSSGPASQLYLNDKASVTYHGPSAGLEVRW